MKYLGLLVLAVGVGVSAAYGARLTDQVAAQTRAEGAAKFAPERAAELEPVETQGPGERLSSWFAMSGVPFLIGLGLVVIGAVVGRIGVRREAQAAAAEGEGGEAGAGPSEGLPTDFGALLGYLKRDAEALAEEMAAREEPTAEARSDVKERLEGMQLEQLERLVDARGQVQIKYGLAGFAAVFGPLSAGERQINRAWSALVDEHWPEATASVKQAVTLLTEAERELAELTGSAAGSSRAAADAGSAGG